MSDNELIVIIIGNSSLVKPKTLYKPLKFPSPKLQTVCKYFYILNNLSSELINKLNDLLNDQIIIVLSYCIMTRIKGRV